MNCEDEWESFKYDSDKYERKRIKVLKEEREAIQTKTFTKWINSVLIKSKEEVRDIFTDFCDGKKLLLLLESVSGERIASCNLGRTRLHKLENVSKCLAFVNSKVRLESIGPEDIVDGNKRLILGLIWTIILRFQIQSLNIFEFNTFNVKSAKEALLLWCQLKTAKYPNVCVNDFNQSWRSGMAFNALIHAHRPDLIEYDRLDSRNPIRNLNLAFDIAYKELGVPRLLDAEDVCNESVDEKSIVTYLSCFYQTIAKLKSDMKCTKRIEKIISQLIEVEKLQLKYEYFTKSLLNWIRVQTSELKDRDLPNDSIGIQHQLIKFKEYISVEKPPKLRERNECEAIHFEIQTVFRSLGHSLYKAPEGLTVRDIEKEWIQLEREENRRQEYLRKEYMRLEKLENLANRFERKCVLRETYIKDKLKILSEPIYGNDNSANFEANYKKHKTISADILAQKRKFTDLSVMAQQLIDGNYYDKEEVRLCERHITNKWRQLLDMLTNHQNVFSAASQLLLAFKEAEAIALEIREMAKGMKSVNRKSLQMPSGIDQLIESHKIFEAQVVSKGKTIDKLNSVSDSISGSDSEQEVYQLVSLESPQLSDSLQTLNDEYTNVSKLVKLKKQDLNQWRDYYRWVQDVEEDETTICERQRLCQSVVVTKDLIGVINLQRKHELLVIDIKTQEKKIKRLIEVGRRLIANDHCESDDIRSRCDSLRKKWKRLNSSIEEKSQHINDAIQAFQYHKDANEVEAWLKEKWKLLDSEDLDQINESMASALLRRHSQLEREIRAFDSDIKKLNADSDKIVKSGISSLFILSGDPFLMATQMGCDQMQENSLDKDTESDTEVDERTSPDGSPKGVRRKRLSIICNAESVEERQTNINSSYLELLNLSFVRRKRLKELVEMSDCQRECDRIEVWIARTKRLVTEFNMNCKRDKLETTALRYEQNPHKESFAEEHRHRQNRIRLEWNQLNVMLNELQDALTTVEGLNSTCDQMVAGLSDQINRDYDNESVDDLTNSDPNVAATEVNNGLSGDQINVDEIVDFLSAIPEEEEYEVDEQVLAFNDEYVKLSYLLKEAEKYLEVYSDVGSDVTEVEVLVRRHEEFITKMVSHEYRLNVFDDSAHKLIDTKKYNSLEIDAKRRHIKERSSCLKEKALLRKQLLNEALEYEQMKTDAEVFRDWCLNKMKIASDESSSHLQDKESKTREYQVFEAELAANQSRLTIVKEKASDMISNNHFMSPSIKSIVESVGDQWNQLCSLSDSKGKRLRQAYSQLTYNKTIERAKERLEELNKALNSSETGSDLRSCKELIQKQLALESELEMWATKMCELTEFGREMAENHFDSQNILKSCHSVTDSLARMKGPAERRKAQLMEAFQFFELEFEINAELQWIGDHWPSAASKTCGQNLTDAQNLLKKFGQSLEREVDGHQKQMDKTVAKGRHLIGEQHFLSESIEEKLRQLEDSWDQLRQLVVQRKKLLTISLSIQQLLSEATEVESWMTEKLDLLQSNDLGKDSESAVKLLTKQKAIELEVDTYSVIIQEMSRHSKELLSQLHDSALQDKEEQKKIIVSRMQDIDQQMNRLQRMVAHRRHRLIQSKHLHEFVRESDQTLQWLAEQLTHAVSDELGRDYEHLLSIQSKFADLRHRVLANEERHKSVVESGLRLARSEEQSGGEDSGGGDPQWVSARVDHLEREWTRLLDALEARDQKLLAAAQIHRFNRDVCEALSRIKDKFSAIQSTDLGKDLHSVESLIRKHEVFENDLVALEAQLQILIDDSVRLQALYPGGNAQHINDQQKMVLEHWTALQERVVVRKSALEQSYQLQALQRTARDLENWAKEVDKQMDTIDRVRDAQSAQLLKVDHQNLKAEIETREEVFQSVVETARLISEQTVPHYAHQEIEAMVKRVLDVRTGLHQKWQLKKVYLDQLIDFHLFVRDCRQLEQLSQQQETSLQSEDLGQSVEEVEQNCRKHEAFEKLMAQTHDEKLSALTESGLKLIKQNHFESPLISEKLDQITVRRNKVKDLSFQRRHRLKDALILAEFRRDVIEAQHWIEEKEKQLALDWHSAPQEISELSLEDKYRQLQKHQSFQLELQSNGVRMASVRQKADHLISKSHENGLEVRSQVEQLIHKWNQLLAKSEQRGRGLEEAQDMFEFKENVDKADKWIRDKERMIGLGDTGEDFEHCLSLQRKLDDVDSDMRVDDKRIKQINALADKLLRSPLESGLSVGGHQLNGDAVDGPQTDSHSNQIQRQRDVLNDKWKQLQTQLEYYRSKLSNAKEVHCFNRDLNDLDEIIQEKCLILDNEEEAKNLEAVESLQRKQEAIEREVNSIELRLKELIENEGRRLIQKYPDMTGNCRTKINEVQDHWRCLNQLCLSKRNKLSVAYTLHRFLKEVKETEIWANDVMNNRMKDSLSGNTTITDARNELQLHDDLKTEITARKEVFQHLKSFGHKVLQQLQQNNDNQKDNNNETNKELVESESTKLDDLRRAVDQCWEERKHYLTQSLQLQMFDELHKQSEDWLSTKEAFLNNEDLGESLAGVESLIRKEDNFETTLVSQQKIAELGKFATDLVQNSHFDSENILAKCQSVVTRKDKLLESAKQRRNKLNDSKLFHKFLRNVTETLGWLNEKIKVASDECYRDPINLLSKIQKHAAFEAELAANKARVDAVVSEGEAIINSGHFMSAEIENNLSYIEKSWRSLLDETNLKKERLQDAYQALQFHRMLDDLEVWMAEIEAVLADEDHGKDLISCQNIMKRHQLIENDINNHSENIEQVKDLSTAFSQNNHFLREEIEERAQSVIRRYEALHQPMQIRRENLEEALLLFQLKRDVDDELIWIDEKQIQVMATDLGHSLPDVQKLKKKHQSIEAEMAAREPLLTTIISKGHSLIRSQHFASKEIQSMIIELQNRVQAIKDAAAVRRARLADAMESQQFYSDVLEAEHWCDERLPFLESQDVGRDEESVIALNKKLDLVNRDVERFGSSSLVKTLQLGNSLLERNHFDSQLIRTKIAELETKFGALTDLCAKKTQKLSETGKHYVFSRDADELLVWIRDQMAIACSEDYGQDVEHVELLIQRFDNFIINLNSNEERINWLRSAARGLEPMCDSKLAQVLMAWSELKETAQSRQDALHGAKQVHTFDRSADETIAWIHEKDSSFALDSTHSPDDDLQSIQTMIRSHEGFERDLAAVREQVEALLEEAKRLATLFPDASEHIFAKNDEVRHEWNRLLERSANRRQHLLQTETLQTYFNQYRELMASIHEMIAVITAEEQLATEDVVSAEIQLNRHKEYKTEMDARNESFVRFVKEGEAIISSGHLMAGEVRERIDRLTAAHKNLIDIWDKRRVIYEHNLDAQQFKHDAQQLERWIASKQNLIEDPYLGDSIADVEDLIRKHEDFEKAIIAQEEKLRAIQRFTLIEDHFRQQKLEEEQLKRSEVVRREQERLQQMKQREQMRILDERRQEDQFYDNKTSHDMDGNPKGLVRRVENLLVPKAVRRAESVKFASPKRTPSFTTRRRSFRSSKAATLEPDQLPPVECEGMLERKQELQAGGKRATVRSWKSFYTVLCGQLLCFFKDKESFFANQAAAPPFSVLGAKCSRAVDYTKRKHVFRLQLNDGSEYLFTTNDESRMQEWLNKVTFHAALPPAMQLLSYDAHKDASIYSGAANASLSQPINRSTVGDQSSPPTTSHRYDTSSQSSSSPEASRKSSIQSISSNPMGSTVTTTSRSSIPANDSVSKRAPPLPPPRTTNPPKSPEPTETVLMTEPLPPLPQRPMSDGYEMSREEIERRQTQMRHNPQYPHREVVSEHNGNHSLPDELFNPYYNAYPYPPPMSLSMSANIARNTTYPTHIPRPPIRMTNPVPLSMYAFPTYNETDSDTEDWHRLDLRYAQTTYQNIPVARHMSLPPNSRPSNKLEPTYQPSRGQSVMTNVTTSSEEEIQSNNSAKTKKKGVMGFFKRNK